MITENKTIIRIKSNDIGGNVNFSAFIWLRTAKKLWEL